MKFSITIPAYKAKFLKECIESILAQTCKDFELVIVNDASPEDLTSIIKSFDDPRIRYYINETNCGAVNVVDNWNKCLDYAIGDYVICMGDDDKLLPGCLEEYAKLIETYPGLGVYHAWTEIIDEDSNVVCMQEPRPIYEDVYSMMWNRFKGRLQFIGDFLFDTQLLRKNGGFYKLPLAWGSDDISAYIAAKDFGIANLQIPAFQYRVNSQTISKKGNTLIKLDAIDKEEKWYLEFLRIEPDKNNRVSYTFWYMLYSELKNHMTKKRIMTIKSDIVNNNIMNRTVYWIGHSKRYKLSFSMIGYAFIEAIKHKIVHKA